MCGIAGIISLNGHRIEASSINQMTDAIAHRGPDGEGCWINEDDTVGLGHRRLSILDISERAKQPMSFANGRYHLTYNGEVFNFLELRIELMSKGYSFISDTDSEVIMAAYHAWGKACLSKFNGMWAFALWDEHEKELFLARDRFGIKPLYYLHEPDKRIVFASETTQFKCLKDFLREFDSNNLNVVMRNSLNLEGFGLTIYKHVKQVLPGHFITLKNKELKQVRWWSTIDNIPEIPVNYETQVETFKELFFDSCRLRMRSDVSLASALSGGLDSSSVYCGLHHYMKNAADTYRIPDNWQKAYVASFPGTTQDETAYAKRVIDHIGGQGVFINPQYDKLVEQTINSTLKFDSVYLTPIFIVEDIYKAMRKDGIVVSMDGHGVDEMMYGYQGTLAPIYHWAKTSGDTEFAKDLESIYGAMFPLNERESQLQQLKENQNGISKNKSYPERVLRKIKSIIKNKKQGWYPMHGKLPEWIARYDQHTFSNPAEKILYQQFHHRTLPTILRNFDRAAMMSSVEIRMPFMDYRLVSFVFGLPLTSKLGHGYTKRILRDAMKRILPEDIRTRTLKIGFSAPMQEWFSGAMAEFINDEVSSESFLESPHWNGKIIQQFANKKIKEKNWTHDDTMQFWPVLNAHILLNKNQ